MGMLHLIYNGHTYIHHIIITVQFFFILLLYSWAGWLAPTPHVGNRSQLGDISSINCQQPPCVQKLSDDKLEAMKTEPASPPEFRLHSQSVERAVKLTSEASWTSYIREKKYEYIGAKTESRSKGPEFRLKKGYVWDQTTNNYLTCVTLCNIFPCLSLFFSVSYQISCPILQCLIFWFVFTFAITYLFKKFLFPCLLLFFDKFVLFSSQSSILKKSLCLGPDNKQYSYLFWT
jgi:hypothetical protein